MIWRLGALAVAGVVALPLLGIASSLLSWQGELWRHIAETQLSDIVGNTVILLVGVGLGTTVIGTGTAWLVTMCRFPGSRMLQWALLLPLVMPTYIIGYAYADLLTFAGPWQSALRGATGWGRGDYWFPDLGSAAGVAFLFTLVLYPYVYLAARAAFLSQSQSLLEASRILGHGPWRTFFRVGLPLARPAIAAGLALALLETLADFGTVQYYGVHTFTTAIYRTWYGMGNREGAAQISLVLIVIAVALVALERRSRGRARFAIASNLRYLAEPVLLAPRLALAAIAACVLPIRVGLRAADPASRPACGHFGCIGGRPSLYRRHNQQSGPGHPGCHHNRGPRAVPELRGPPRPTPLAQPRHRIRFTGLCHPGRGHRRRHPAAPGTRPTTASTG